MLCEGGPTLLEELAVADLIDEMCFTVSPTLAGQQHGPRMVRGALGAPVAFRLRHVLADEDFLLTRYVRDRGGSADGRGWT